MNQHQRKFLLDEIDKQYRRENEALRERKPRAPSLNNYLIAAILDGSAVMRPLVEVRDAIRERVRDLGKGETLISSSERRRWGRGSDDEEDAQNINIPALLLFEEPPAYAEKRAAYLEALEKWKVEAEILESAAGAMKIKVQVGSDKAMEVLVDQADKLCTMSLSASSKLLLT